MLDHLTQANFTQRVISPPSFNDTAAPNITNATNSTQPTN
jgi:hypothetical protein